MLRVLQRGEYSWLEVLRVVERDFRFASNHSKHQRRQRKEVEKGKEDEKGKEGYQERKRKDDVRQVFQINESGEGRRNLS